MVLCIDGWGWPGNIIWAFLSGCCPVVISVWQVHFLRHFTPGLHYFYVDPADPRQLLSVLDYVWRNDQAVAQMARACRQLAEQVLTPQALRAELDQDLEDIEML